MNNRNVQDVSSALMDKRRVKELELWNDLCEKVEVSWKKWMNTKEKVLDEIFSEQLPAKAMTPGAKGPTEMRTDNAWLIEYKTILESLNQKFLASGKLLGEIFKKIPDIKSGLVPKYRATYQKIAERMEKDLGFLTARHHLYNALDLESDMIEFVELRSEMKSQGVVKQKHYDSVMILGKDEGAKLSERLIRLGYGAKMFSAELKAAILNYNTRIVTCWKDSRKVAVGLNEKMQGMPIRFMDSDEEKSFNEFVNGLKKFEADNNTFAFYTALSIMAPDESGNVFMSLSKARIEKMCKWGERT